MAFTHAARVRFPAWEFLFLQLPFFFFPVFVHSKPCHQCCDDRSIQEICSGLITEKWKGNFVHRSAKSSSEQSHLHVPACSVGCLFAPVCTECSHSHDSSECLCVCVHTQVDSCMHTLCNVSDSDGVLIACH